MSAVRYRYWSWLSPSIGRSRPACGTKPTIQPRPKKTPGPPAGQSRPRKTFLVHPWPPARHQASPPMPPAPKALAISDKLIDAQATTAVLHALAVTVGIGLFVWAGRAAQQYGARLVFRLGLAVRMAGFG